MCNCLLLVVPVLPRPRQNTDIASLGMSVVSKWAITSSFMSWKCSDLSTTALLLHLHASVTGMEVEAELDEICVGSTVVNDVVTQFEGEGAGCE